MFQITWTHLVLFTHSEFNKHSNDGIVFPHDVLQKKQNFAGVNDSPQAKSSTHSLRFFLLGGFAPVQRALGLAGHLEAAQIRGKLGQVLALAHLASSSNSNGMNGRSAYARETAVESTRRFLAAFVPRHGEQSDGVTESEPASSRVGRRWSAANTLEGV